MYFGISLQLPTIPHNIQMYLTDHTSIENGFFDRTRTDLREQRFTSVGQNLLWLVTAYQFHKIYTSDQHKVRCMKNEDLW